ncbi:MAG TPA: hypothetical protein VIK62_02920 [Verrucomicrobiae bacterium]
MKRLIQFTTVILFLGGLVFSARASFSSIYVFGDTISATTTNNVIGTSGTNYFYGTRYSNGRDWVEVLAQRQGLGANSITNANWAYSSNNLSFYGQYSPLLVTNINKFVAPANATNCLFIVWVDNADFVGDMTSFGSPPAVNNQAAWTAAINQHLTNHFNAITKLYAKGCRTLIAPNAVDVTTVPQFNNSSASWRTFVRQQIVNFNTSYAAMLNQIQSSPSYPGLKIYAPDIFSLLNNVLTNAASYGLTNALSGGFSIDVMETPSLSPWALNGPGTNYIFWDPNGDPTAKMQAIVADTVQQMISPVQINGLTQINGSNRLDVVNMPVGLNGFLDGSTNLAQAGNWTLVTNFNSTGTAQSIFVVTPPLPANFGAGGSGGSGGLSGPPVPGQGGSGSTTSTNTDLGVNFAAQFYRLRFPYAWNWP